MVAIKVSDKSHKNNTSTFTDNMSLPIHRWFRYSAGFSAQWVSKLIEQEKANGRQKVLDPFVGSGTVLLSGDTCGIEAKGIESHPFVTRIARAKLHWQEDPEDFRNYALNVLARAKTSAGDINHYPDLIRKCFPDDALHRLDTLRRALNEIGGNSPLAELTWLLLASILRACSPAGTAQWQYILPNKTKTRFFDPYDAFEAKLSMMIADMAAIQRTSDQSHAVLYTEDTRKETSIPAGWADLVVTSPPYANNYDYADAVRLEMCFFGDISSWGDLQETVRKHLIRACTQHVGNIVKETYQIASDPLLTVIQQELLERCRQLEAEKNKHGGKKNYHTMIAAYFYDMAQCWHTLRQSTGSDALICFVIGDSAPYGVHIPVERWLGKLAIAAGFTSYSFEKLRDRNKKWKNRKHDVPLHEGLLWVKS